MSEASEAANSQSTGVAKKKSRWVRWDRLMRALHLYTSLFLVPWMTVYAFSAFFLNHNEWFVETLELAPKWEVVSEDDFNPGPGFPQVSEDQALAIVKHLDVDGPHTIQVDNANQMIIFRNSITGHYRITWQRQPSRLTMQKHLPVSFYSVINNLHFQRGYSKQRAVYMPWLVWGLVVDFVTISTLIWIISGIYLWARRPRKRLLGGVCLVAGCVLFVWLVVLLCK